MYERSVPGYQHTQKGPWFLLLYGFGLLMLVVGWLVREVPVVPVVLLVAGGIMLLLGACFQHLTVADEGERLAIRFGPLPLFEMRVHFGDIEEVEVGRTTLLDGWGIHLSLKGGWVWNIWGRDCVVIRRKDGVLRIGTDDAGNLAAFLRTKMSNS